MAKVTLDTIKETIKLMDELNGTNHYDEIDWDNPSKDLPAFLKKSDEEG